MEDKKQVRNIIIFIGIIIIFSLIYIGIDKLINQGENDYNNFLKNYEVNEYIPTYVSDEDMARLYLNDYVHIMYSDIETAYSLLDEEYSLKKFGNIENYKNYINTLKYPTYKMDKYYIKDTGKYKIFGVYDTNGNTFIFKTNGVMQYTVYLDEDTIEIR